MTTLLTGMSYKYKNQLLNIEQKKNDFKFSIMSNNNNKKYKLLIIGDTGSYLID
jgi:hypothetical protein